MHRFFPSDFFNFEFLRLISMTANGGCEIAEALSAVALIKDNDDDSWSRAWASCSEHAEALAKDAAAAGDVVAARAAYLRAANYTRASQYLWSDRKEAPDPRLLPAAERYVALFRKGAALLDEAEVRFLDIPYEDGKHLPAILYLPRPQFRLPNEKIPIVVNVNGGDSVQEELFFVTPSTGPRLGYAVLTFDGPGQGMAIRREGLHMRPDYEIVIGKVLDFLWQYNARSLEMSLDPDRLAIVGASLGAYFALRAAVDPRVKACVSIDPPYDMWELATAKMPNFFLNAWLSGWISDGFVNGVVGLLSRTNFQLKWEVGHMMWTFGLQTPAMALRALQNYNFKSEDGKSSLSLVRCPTLVSGAAGSIYFDPQSSTTRIYDELTALRDDQKKSWIPKEPREGGLQAKIGAFGVSNMRTFAFLDIHFDIQRQVLQ